MAISIWQALHLPQYYSEDVLHDDVLRMEQTDDLAGNMPCWEETSIREAAMTDNQLTTGCLVVAMND